MGHKTPIRPHRWVYLTPSSGLGPKPQLLARSALTSSAIRVGIPCFFMYIQGSLWGQHSNKPGHFAIVRKRGYEKKWRREWEDNGLLHHTLQATALASSMENRQVNFHEVSRLLLWVRSHVSEPEPPAGLATNIHPHLAPLPTRNRPGETVGYLPQLISHYIISMLFFPELTGPGASYSTWHGWHTSKSIPVQVNGPGRLTD